MDEFICISCWKEFTVPREEVARRSGNVVCPHCGYILQVDTRSGSGPAASPAPPPEEPPPVDPEQLSLDTDEGAGQAQVLDWKEVLPDEDSALDPEPGDAVQLSRLDGLDTAQTPAEEPESPIDEEETDRGTLLEGDVEFTPPKDMLLDMDTQISEDDDEIGFDDPMADEKTPIVPTRAPAEFLAEEMAQDEDALGGESIEWRLRTQSGLTFRFTDPDALLGWKKKVAIYKQMEVSPDGERWVDYVRFVEEFEACGDARKAFILSESAGEGDLPPPVPKGLPDMEESSIGQAVKTPVTTGSPTSQFTFKTAESKDSSAGKYILLVIIGLALGAGAMWLAWTYFNGGF